MRNRDTNDNRSEMPETAVVRRMRSRRSLRVETAEAIYFNVAAFRLDRKLGVAEHIAVERNLRVVNAWPEMIYD